MKMAVLRATKEGNKDKASVPKGGEILQRKSVFGKYSDLEMLSQLKGIAIDPCNSEVSKVSIRPLWNQTLRVREVMALGQSPRRKRKLHQFLKEKFIAAAGLASEVSNQQKVTKLSKGQLSHASSVSCVLNTVDSIESIDQKTLLSSHSSVSFLTFEDNFQRKRISSGFSSLDNATDCGPPNKYISPFVDSDESVNGSNPLTPENLTFCESPSLDFDESVHSENFSNSEPKGMNLQTPRRSIRLLNFIGDHLQRLTIPIGPRFQADVPEWISPINKEYLNNEDTDSESSRWLGTRVWPIEGRNVETNARAVGKGRPDSCSCGSPGSTDCIKHHILEERRLLKSNLGPAFLSWKFNEMGELVSKSWTLKEQQRFDSLVKTYPPSNGKNFLKHALKCFPHKCRKDIVSYYLNVFIPRRMRLQTRLCVTEVDSDDDEVEDVNNVDLQERRKVSSIRGSSKDVKTRYLRLRR